MSLSVKVGELFGGLAHHGRTLLHRLRFVGPLTKPAQRVTFGLVAECHQSPDGPFGA